MINSYKNSFIIKVFGCHFLSLDSEKTSQRAIDKRQTKPRQVYAGLTIPETAAQPPLFLVNSLFLWECFTMLTKTDDESLHAITGSIIGNLRTLDRIIPLQLSLQSSVGAEAETCSLATEFMRLHDFGILPLAYFHSHPSCGVNATYPSGIDRQTQSTMEESGSEIIGGIFSRDGYVRFYANKSEPNICVVGKRVRKVGKNVYLLEIEENV